MNHTLGVVIRFKDSAATLPRVLECLQHQTRRPDLIVGVDTGSADGSAALVRAAGGTVVPWTQAYSHPRVLNFGIDHCPTDLVLALSSHTTLEAPDTVERMVACFADGRTACVSGKWDADPFYSDAIDLGELRAKGMKFGSIYSNSMGMLRRAFWEEVKFDDTLPTAEDYAWAVAQLARGRTCRRLDFPFGYHRAGNNRVYEFAHTIFSIARRHGLPTTWLGPKGSLLGLLHAPDRAEHWDKLRAWAATRVGHAA